jgi:hypothetical protein
VPARTWRLALCPHLRGPRSRPRASPGLFPCRKRSSGPGNREGFRRADCRPHQSRLERRQVPATKEIDSRARSKPLAPRDINERMSWGTMEATMTTTWAPDPARDGPAPSQERQAALRGPDPCRRPMPGSGRARRGALPAFMAGSRPGPGPRKAARASPRHSAGAGRLIVPQAFRRGRHSVTR